MEEKSAQETQVQVGLESESHYQDLFEGARLGIYHTSPEGQFVDATPALVQVLGFPDRETLLATNAAELYPDPQARQQWRARLEREGVVCDFETQVRRYDGAMIWVRDTSRVVKDAAGQVLYYEGSLEDITERKQLEHDIQQSLERYAQQVQISTEVAQEIASATALDELYRRVVTLVKERFGYYHAQIFRLDPKLEAMVVTEGYGQAGEKMKAAGHSLPYGHGIVGTVADTGQPALASDVSQDPHWVTSPFLPDTQGELAVPIKLRDNVLGVLDVQSDVAGALTQEDLVLLLGLAGQIAVAIQNTNLLEQSQEMLAKAQESERLLRAVIDATPDWIFIKDREHRYRLVNQGYAESLSLDPDDFIGRDDLELGFSAEQVKGDPEKGICGFWTHDQSVIESGETLAYRGDPVLIDSEVHYFHSIKTPVRDAEGNVWGVLGFSRDVTEREQLLAEVQRSEELLRTILDATPDWIFVKDQQHRFSLVNRSFAKAYGLDPEEILGKDNLDLGWPEEMVKGDLEQGIQGIWVDDREVMDSGQPKFIPRELVQLKGERRLFETTKAPLFDAEGKVWGLAGFARDITEREKLLSEIKQSEELLRNIIDATPDWIFIKDQEHRYRLANQGYADALHISPEDFIGKNDLELGFPEELVKGDPEKGIRGFWADDRWVLDSGETQIYPDDPATIDGEIHIFHSIKTPLRDASGHPWGVLAFCRDVTEREQLVAELEHRAVQLQTAAQVSRAASEILDEDELLITSVNLIRDRFDLYYAGIFLVDETGTFAALRAGTGEAGRQMRTRGHRLKVGGESMVGWSIANAEARVAQVAEEDALRLATPELPDTRAEAALPLRSRGEVIGALSVQSDRPGTFDETAITVLQTMADQVAVALTNADLFAQTEQRAVELAQATRVAEAARQEAEQEKEKAETARDEAQTAKEKAEAASRALAEQMWQTAGQAQLGDRMRGEQSIPQLAENVIQQLCHYLEAKTGILYVMQHGVLNAAGKYASGRRQDIPDHFKLGEGLVGQAALEGQAIVLTDVPDGYLPIASGLGAAPPRHILVSPFLYEDQVAGVVELGTLTEFNPAKLEFLQTALANIAIAFNTAQARAHIDELLVKTQQQAEELQAQSEELQTQSEELRVANEELQTQTDNLRRSEMALREKQSELEEANAELEARAAALQEKQAILDQQNRELTVAQAELQQKAEELAQASKYKSEFLANMSHELRTPLNSLLILAGMLQQNEEGNLTADQVESLQVIHHSGRDLLELINDILDLSKIEAGRMTFQFEPAALDEVVESMRIQFAPVAEEKGLAFRTSLVDDLPATIETDRQRVHQILKNLLSNAFKFTESGCVELQVHRPASLPGRFATESGLATDQVVALSVTDTGIGIALEQQRIVFEAFQQVEGGTSRKYGGTGLGLSISRELSLWLGGYLGLESEPGKGSTFTLYLPVERAAEQRAGTPVSSDPAIIRPAPSPGPPTQEKSPTPAPIPDDRDALAKGDRILLIIEDDAEFARIVCDFAHKKGFKCLAAGDGETGLALASTYRPDAIVLDLHLPRLSGWEVLTTLKDSPDTRHIPVHIMSADAETLDAYKHGAMGFLTKPIDSSDLEGAFQRIESFTERAIKTLLVVEDEANLRRGITKLLSGGDVRISEAGTGQAALDLLHGQHFDCMILDLSLPDLSGFDVLNQMDKDETITKCPVIVYTGRELTPEESQELMRYADSVIVKGVKSPERLLDETALFLHRVVADLPEDKQRTIRRLHDQETFLTGRRILIVDDDARSAFALSKLLADKGLKVNIARDGQQALEFLAKTPDVDVVLMDVMMPVMDGYETIRRIRAQPQFATLPILALTAKAMVGDREKCLEAGASDYLPKPIDPERLFSMLRVWLYQ